MKLFDWQQRAVQDSADHDGWGLFARPGTGKTLAALTIATTADLLPVVICPKAVKAQWRDAGATHVWHYEQLRNKTSLAAIVHQLRTAQCCLILDESHRIANPSTQTAKAAMKLAPLATKRLCLTGTPTANSPADLWSQLRFLRPTAALETRRTWQERYMECLPRTHPLMQHLRGNPFIPRRNRDGSLVLKHIDELAHRVATYGTSVQEHEMADLPERTFQVRLCTPSALLAHAYDEMRRLYMTDVAGTILTAENAAVLATRLLRLASGLGEMDSEARFPNPKLAQLYEDLPSIVVEGRTIIWSVWRQERNELCTHLSQTAISWTNDVEEFLASDRHRVLVGSPKQIGAGLNIQAATYQVWVSRGWSLIEREQALHRNHRVGQTQRTTVIDYLTANTLDLVVMRALTAKTNLLTYIMNGSIE